MDTLRLCTQCREPLPLESTDRVCVRCHGDPGRSPSPASSAHHSRMAPPSVAEIAPLFPHLEILELLDHGGMGMVYKARQPALGRLVALKILAPELGGDPAFAERFTREAQALARLHHSNIVSIYDFGRAGAFYYFLMEFVDGANLHQLIQSRSISPEEARRIVLEVCHALEFAHDEGVVHRDIKPANILLDKKGRVKIADFGLAKLSAETLEAERRPALTTASMGTPHYIAPEQIENTARVDRRADIYSLGVVFYEMLTGQLPLGRFEPPSQKSNSNPRWDEIVLRALERDPGKRYQTASEIRLALETSTVAPLPPTETALPAPPKRRGWFYLAQFLLMIGAAALALVIYAWAKDHFTVKQKNLRPPAQSPRAIEPAEGAMGRRILAPLQLTRQQQGDVSRVIRRYQREFVAVEKRHTEHAKDAAGHINIVVKPFPRAADQLMELMWVDLAAILTPQQLATAKTLELQKFFPNTGRTTTKVSIWRDAKGNEHYTESEDLGTNSADLEIPPRFRGYLPDQP